MSKSTVGIEARSYGSVVLCLVVGFGGCQQETASDSPHPGGAADSRDATRGVDIADAPGSDAAEYDTAEGRDVADGGGEVGTDTEGDSFEAPTESAWNATFSTGSEDIVQGVGIDGDGGVYVAGWTKGAVESGSKKGAADAFVSKFGSDGNRQWVRQFGTGERDRAWDVAVTADGAAYVVGRTSGDLGGESNAGSADGFVVKFASDGERQWTRLVGSQESDIAYGIALDSDGQLAVCGSTEGELEGRDNRGFSDGFVQRLDSDGTPEWTRTFGSSERDVARSCAAGDRIYAVGRTEGDFGGGSASPRHDGFVVAYKTGGGRAWSTALRSDEPLAVRAAVVGGDGVAVGGFANGGFAGQNNSGVRDGFVGGYTDGQRSWIDLFGTSAFDQVQGLSSGPSGWYVSCGETRGNFGGGGFDTTHFFMRGYRPSGGPAWTLEWATETDSTCFDIAVSDERSLAAVGRMSTSANQSDGVVVYFR